MYDAELEYAGFWRRAAAMLLDAAIIAPIGFGLAWLLPTGAVHPVISVGHHLTTSILFGVYLVYRFGGTPGKLVMRLAITNIHGEPVTWKQAFLRASPELLFGTLVIAGTAIAAWELGVPQPIFPTREEARLLQTVTPFWLKYVMGVGIVWNWSELIVMLTNRRRRALHDFLAGTVVIRRRVKPSLVSGQPLPPDGTWRESALRP